jgi:hypothetical protein
MSAAQPGGLVVPLEMYSVHRCLHGIPDHLSLVSAIGPTCQLLYKRRLGSLFVGNSTPVVVVCPALVGPTCAQHSSVGGWWWRPSEHNRGGGSLFTSIHADEPDAVEKYKRFKYTSM